MRKKTKLRACMHLLWGMAFLLSLAGNLYAQDVKPVTGRVLDETGSPVSNASVSVDSSGKSTLTDSLGRFTVRLKMGDVVKLKHISFAAQSVVYKGQALLEITMKKADNAMEDVVVTGYQTVNKKLFSGSSSTLSAKELERAGLPDVTKMLEGQFAGVSLQNVSGTFGAAPKLRIRGATSLSGDNKPLWVINGIIVEDVVNISNEALTSGDMNTLLGSSIAGVNPSDIEDITVLRDAAATALYGARAMNGVVVITTKKGRATATGSPSVNYTGNFSRYIKPRYANYDILNSADQLSVLVDEMNLGYFQMPDVLAGASGGVLYQMYDQIRTYNSTDGKYGLRNDAASKLAFLTKYGNANTDWFDIIFKNSLIQEHSISISSGTEKFQTYASTSYMKDEGATLGNNVERFTGNFRMNFNVGKRFRGELLSSGSVRNQRAPGTESQISEPVYGSYYRNFDINPYAFALNASRMMTAYDDKGNLQYYRNNYAPFNIINELNSNYMKLSEVDYQIQGTVGYKILPGLEYSILGSYRNVKTENQTYILENSNRAEAYRANYDATMIGSNQFLYSNPAEPNALPYVVLPDGGFYNVESNNMKAYYLRHQLDFKTYIKEDHVLNAFVSVEFRGRQLQNEYFNGVGYQYDNGGLVNPYYLYFKQSAETGREYYGMQPYSDRFQAYMGTLTYSYKNKYTLTPTLRYDGSNKMGKSSVARWLPTWNIAGSWAIHQEGFWKQNDVVSSALLRASYGLTGNIGAATNTAATFYNQISYRPYAIDQETLTYISDLENSQLTWEKSTDLDIGTEIGFMKSRINLVADYYERRIHDLIGTVQTSGIGGQFSKVGNYAKMAAHGLEFTVNAKVLTSKDFGWTARFNIAHNTNKITELKTDPLIWNAVSGNGAAVKGYAQSAVFSVPFVGLDHNFGYPTFIGPNSSNPTTYINLQSDQIGFLKYEGPTDPTLTGGFYNQFRYKNFTLSALFKFSAGNVLRLTPSIKNTYTDMQAMTRDMLNRWRMPGDETKTTVPAILDPISSYFVVDENGGQVNTVYPYNLYNYSSARVVSGDFIKLQNVSLAYMLPAKLLKKTGAKTASLAVVANNIAVLKADKRLNGQDPEFFNSGGVALPSSKQVTLSVKLGF